MWLIADRDGIGEPNQFPVSRTHTPDPMPAFGFTQSRYLPPRCKGPFKCITSLYSRGGSVVTGACNIGRALKFDEPC
jgi:hypothetical protein